MNEPADDGLPPLREVIARHGLSARKSLGQNFLLDLNLTRRIARAAGPLEGATVLEVGPGAQLTNMAQRCLPEAERGRLTFLTCLNSPADASLGRVLQLVGGAARPAGQALFRRLRVP